MPLNYTQHAQGRIQQRGLSLAEVEAAVENDDNPWEHVLNGGNHLRYFYSNVTVITNKAGDLVVTVWRGERGGW